MHVVDYAVRLLEEELLRHLDPEVKAILEVGNYIISSGGKRIRPVLSLLTCKALGGDERKVLPLAVGIEYIHVASLLHDDVVDGADRRRGRLSANVVFGNELCVLTGDYMYAKALWLYSRYGNMKSIEIVSRAVMDMAQGQVLELKSIGDIIDQETYFSIIDKKTGVLFGASMAVGALVAGREDYERFYQMGLKVGRAFQLVDDALDYSGSEEKLGKPVGNDLREGKCTYPLISVMENLDTEVVRSSLRNSNTAWIREKVIQLGGVKKTYQMAKVYIEEALKELRQLMGENNTKVLETLVLSVIERER
ncbi:MAG: polyprenyl synthetase family protein [Hydrogenobacter thermophilus]|uniref:polyprenyl synthetase family protein n=1 Tax=Hydrogenobacter thermophilus TaxID=940 RepID=UPI001C76813E|nr:polyprenyl synthetase family protein [Hydrogenobacter thermophilus]QWK20514.1 MAG: polyprenyl synthetase family protein [Hydrogenobacter thermophilus]